MHASRIACKYVRRTPSAPHGWSGFDIDLLDLVAASLGFTYNITSFDNAEDASWDEACGALKAARPRARGRHNTFRQQLEQLADGPKANVLLADHRSLDIRDGGNDPCDDDRR